MKCRDCPLSLRCYAGKLTPTNWCPECHYLVCHRGPLQVSLDASDVVTQSVRLRCELRTEEMLRIGVTRGVAPDPIVAKNQIGVTRCSKCEAIKRLREGLRVAVPPEAYDKIELD